MLLVMLFVLARAAAPASTPAATPTPVLDEEPPAPTIVERIDEPAAPAAAPVVLPVQPPTPAPKPTPAAPKPTPAAPRPAPVAPPPPTPRPKAGPVPPPPAPASAAVSYGVHVASYRKKEIADAEAKRIGEALALPARVVRVELGAKGVWYRVVVGDAPSASDAARLRDAVKAKGYPDALVVRSR